MTETNIETYVTLIINRALNKPETQLWFNRAISVLPSGTNTSIQQVDAEGNPQNVQLVHKKFRDGHHEYIIPLTRSLTQAEVEKVHVLVQNDFPEEISVQTNVEYKPVTVKIENLQETDFDLISHEFAKLQHNDWVRSMSDKGWKFGMEYDPASKTHPLLRTWDYLSPEEKKADYNSLKNLILILKNFGYQIKKTKQ